MNPSEGLYIEQSKKLPIAQSAELPGIPLLIPELLPPEAHTSSDSGSQLDVCFVLMFCRFLERVFKEIQRALNYLYCHMGNLYEVSQLSMSSNTALSY